MSQRECGCLRGTVHARITLAHSPIAVCCAPRERGCRSDIGPGADQTPWRGTGNISTSRPHPARSTATSSIAGTHREMFSPEPTRTHPPSPIAQVQSVDPIRSMKFDDAMTTDDRHALVLGGNGFIGSHVVRALIRDGHAVTAVNRGRRESPTGASPRWSITWTSPRGTIACRASWRWGTSARSARRWRRR